MNFIIIMILILCSIGAMGILLSKKKKESKNNVESVNAIPAMRDSDSTALQGSEGLQVSFESLPVLGEEDERRLVEIKDKKLLARIDGVIPGTAQIVANTAALVSHNHNSTVKFLKDGGTLYRAVIPNDAALANSKTMSGAFRGFYRGASGIKGQANLIAENGYIGGGLAAMNVVCSLASIAAMVVGQYYMSQINNRLEKISDEIAKISDFLDFEFMSKVYVLINEIRVSSTFQVDIMEDWELRSRELDNLENWRHECAQLLVQANLMLQNYSKEKELKCEKYETKVGEAAKWYQYQQYLLKVMGRIIELQYALNLGKISKEYCNCKYNPYVEQASAALGQIYIWHKNYEQKYQIELGSERRKRQGVGGFIMSIPGLFNDDLNYKAFSGRTAEMIRMQKNSIEEKENGVLFSDDVQLIAKEGKLYYLPAAKKQ